MKDEPRPSGNWLRMHRGWGVVPKKRHATWLSARWHKRQHVRRFKLDADTVQVYPCWFTDENDWGRRHWHIGHVPHSRKRTARMPKPKAGRLYLGVFALEEGGFEVRVFDTVPPRVLGSGATPDEAVDAYLRERKRDVPYYG